MYIIMKNFMNSNDEFRFNEILFENRNKKYGAYALRMEEGNVLKKSLLIGIGLFACLSITPLVLNSLKGAEIVKPPEGVEVVLTGIVEPPTKKPEIIKTTTPVAPPKVNTFDSRVATPTRDANESTVTKPSKDSDAVPGTENIEGLPPTTITKPPVINIVAPPEIVKPPIDDKAIIKNVDIEASFNGGINAFRNKVVQNFDTNSFEGTGDLMKTIVTFIVEKDGTISAVKANGANTAFNKEAEATIKNIKGKWFPAKLDGKNVRSYFSFPVSMQFE